MLNDELVLGVVRLIITFVDIDTILSLWGLSIERLSGFL